MTKHEHNFIPVDVTWSKYRIGIEHIEEPEHVILACSCGKVKLVKAKLMK